MQPKTVAQFGNSCSADHMARAAFLALAALARALPTGEHTGALDTRAYNHP